MHSSPHNKPKIEHEVSDLDVGLAVFMAEVINSKHSTVVLFWAPWSHPCQVMKSVLIQVAKACAWRARVVKVNADDNPELSLLYEIQSIPTLLFFTNGTLRARIVGTVSKEAILAKLQPFIALKDAHSHLEQTEER